MDLVSPPSTWSRPAKRRPAERSPEQSPKTYAEEPELRRMVEELEEEAERMRGAKEAAEAAARALRGELEAERGASETAASEAMLMIERLQREKAAALMEARQFRRFAEGHADRDREVQDELASLSDLAASYLSRLQAHGIDPDFTDEDEDEEQEEEEEEEGVEEGINSAELETDGNDESCGGNSSNGNYAMEIKGIAEESSSPVEKEFEYTVDVGCAGATKAAGAVEEYVGEGNAGDLYARVLALEADRAAMRKEIMALRMERAQLVVAREMARRLCREVVAERMCIVKKAPAAGGFSALATCKWLFSIIVWRKKGSTARYTFGLSTTFLALLLLLDRSTVLSPWRRLWRPQR